MIFKKGQKNFTCKEQSNIPSGNRKGIIKNKEKKRQVHI